MPESSAADTERKRLGREAGRRREAAAALRLAATMATYAARQLSDGLTPEQAREATLEAAGRLEGLAESLRRLTRLRPAERRAVAMHLARLGHSRKQIAQYLGVSDRAVYYYVRGRPSP